MEIIFTIVEILNTASRLSDEIGVVARHGAFTARAMLWSNYERKHLQMGTSKTMAQHLHQN